MHKYNYTIIHTSIMKNYNSIRTFLTIAPLRLLKESSICLPSDSLPPFPWNRFVAVQTPPCNWIILVHSSLVYKQTGKSVGASREISEQAQVQTVGEIASHRWRESPFSFDSVAERNKRGRTFDTRKENKSRPIISLVLSKVIRTRLQRCENLVGHLTCTKMGQGLPYPLLLSSLCLFAHLTALCHKCCTLFLKLPSFGG